MMFYLWLFIRVGWLVGFWHINTFQVIQHQIKVQTIQFIISIVFVFKQLNAKIVLFQTIQFSISTLFSSIWPIDRTLSGVATPGQSGPGSNSNERVIHIPQSSSITGALPSDFWVSYLGHSLGERVLPLCREAVSVFYCPSQLGKLFIKIKKKKDSTQLHWTLLTLQMWYGSRSCDSLWLMGRQHKQDPWDIYMCTRIHDLLSCFLTLSQYIHAGPVA